MVVNGFFILLLDQPWTEDVARSRESLFWLILGKIQHAGRHYALAIRSSFININVDKLKW